MNNKLKPEEIRQMIDDGEKIDLVKDGNRLKQLGNRETCPLCKQPLNVDEIKSQLTQIYEGLQNLREKRTFFQSYVMREIGEILKKY